MTEKPVGRLLLSLSVPTVASQMVTVIYNTADTWFVSHIDKSTSGAVGVAFALMSIIQAFGYGFGMGAASLISRKLGEGKKEEADMYGSSAFAASMFFGAIVQIFGLIFLEPLMRLLGATETILPYACEYSKYILIAAPIMCGSFVLGNILRAEGEATLSMIGLCTGGVLNIALDPLLIFVFNMGISGASIATAVSQTVGFAVLISFFLTKKSIIRLNVKNISRRFKDYLKIISTGLPTVCRQGFGSIATALLNRKARLYGDAAVAAISIVNKIYSLVRASTIGIGQAFQTVAGYNYGAEKYKRTKKAFNISTAAGTVLCVVCAACVFAFPKTIMNWFIKDAETISIGVNALYYLGAVMPMLAYSTFVNQLYQCLGFRTCATILASLRQGIFFIPLALLLPEFLQLTGVELVQPGADLLTFLVSIPFQIVFFVKYLKEK